ncbi:RNA ligase 2 [Pelomyxa schiedti]|nr:RNA ligase 2 [Pelomyxa schiedti]
MAAVDVEVNAEESGSAASGVVYWPEITGLAPVVARVTNERTAAEAVAILPGADASALSRMVYRPKVKLHGSNAAVHVSEEGIAPQSRTRVLTETSDMAGFARFILSKSAFFNAALGTVKAAFPLVQNITVFGEWCGPGIQSGVAVSAIGKKIWAIFSIELHLEGKNVLVTDPPQISAILPPLPTDIHILPWYTSEQCGESITMDLKNTAQMEEQTPKINQLVEAIDHEDPWVFATFGVRGTGEGVVWYPVSLWDADKVFTVEQFGAFSFKTKGQHHAMVQPKGKKHTPAQVAPDVAASIEEFAHMFVTEARCQQGIGTVCPDGPTKSATGKFLKWMVDDVKKESKTELAASNLTWNPQIEKAVGNAARQWFVAQKFP